MKNDAVVDFLGRLPLLAGRSRGELARLASLTHVCHVPPGQVLVGQDTDQISSFVIIEGRAEVTLRDAPVELLDPGDFVDEISLERLSVWATVTAVTPMSLLVVPPEAIVSLMQSTPEPALDAAAKRGA